MRKFSILFALLAAGVAFTACDETKDDNPVLRTHEGQPQVNFLNVPSLQNTYIDFTEENQQDNLHLTCSQPTEYGLATTVNYFVQVSLDPKFSYYGEVPNGFTDCSQINPTNDGVAEAICTFMQEQKRAELGNPDYELTVDDIMAYSDTYYPAYVRLRSQVVGISDNAIPGTEYISNVVEYKHVFVQYKALVPPDKQAGVFIMGGMNGWAAQPDYEFFTTKVKGTFITKPVIVDANVTFKISPASWNSDFPFSGGVTLNGGGNGDEAVDFGDPFSLNNDINSGNLYTTENFNGMMVLIQKGKNFTLTLVPIGEVKDYQNINGILGPELKAVYEPYLD